MTEEEEREVDPDVIMENILNETDDQGNIHTMEDTELVITPPPPTLPPALTRKRGRGRPRKRGN